MLIGALAVVTVVLGLGLWSSWARLASADVGRSPLAWAAAIWGLQFADIATTALAVGLFGPRVEGNEFVLHGIGFVPATAVKLLLVPALLAAVALRWRRVEALIVMRMIAFLYFLVVASNLVGMLAVVRWIAEGHLL